MYSKERALTIAKKDVKFIPTGIIENVTLKSARVAKSPTGKDFLEITFEKEGATLTQTEWKPTKFEGMTDEQLQAKEDTQFSRMMQILLCFYKNEELVFNGTSFEEFANEVVTYLNNADKSKLLRVKVVYNKDGYTTLPSYAKYTFIEPMVLPEGSTSAIVELGIDQFTKPVTADSEKTVTNLATSLTLNAMGTSSVNSFTTNDFTSVEDSNPNQLPF
jgi:hypothetical protein